MRKAGSGADTGPVVILGGGLTGISTAVHLRAPWLLFEKEERLGGHARTDERDGYRFDKTGHWLHLRDPDIKQLVDELLARADGRGRAQGADFSHGVLTRYPFQANLRAAGRGRQGVPAGRHRGAWHTGAGRRPPANFEDYCLRHFGAGISQALHDPLQREDLGRAPARDHRRPGVRASCRCPTSSRWSRAPWARARPRWATTRLPLPEGRRHRDLHARAAPRLQRGRGAHERQPRRASTGGAREVVVGGERLPYRVLVATIPLPELLAHARAAARRRGAAARLRCTTLRYLNVGARGRRRPTSTGSTCPRSGIRSTAWASTRTRALHGAPWLRLALRRDVRSRPDHRRDSSATRPQALVAAGALARPNDVVFADRRRSSTRTSCSTSTTTRRRAPSSRSWRRTRSTRAAATGPGPTTRWKTACWPGARCGADRRGRRADDRTAERRTSRSSSPSTTRRGSCAVGARAARRSCAASAGPTSSSCARTARATHRRDRQGAGGRAPAGAHDLGRRAELRAGA